MPLPTVLAGPIVRRVEPRLCSFWIALPEASEAVTATVWLGLQMAFTVGGSVVSGDAPIVKATSKTRRFGKHLHVALVTVTIPEPAPPLSPGTIYSYDITVDGKGLKQLGLLADEVADSLAPEQRQFRPLGLALGYVTDRLPSFVTPPPVIEQTRFVHCSCRNTIGPGYDALAWMDTIIASQLTNTAERPQQLFMTGDQIYADDLSGALLFMLSNLAQQLIGTNEMMHVSATPPDGGALVDKSFPVNLTSFPAYRRHKLTVDVGGYTSGDGENHLLGYGEYCAMYLAVWSPRMWGELGTVEGLHTALPEAHELRPFFDQPEKAKPFNGSVPAWLAAQKAPDSWFNTSAARLKLFRDGVPHVARALANIATYMIFDDHDVTDDWNLHKKWTNRVYSKPFGKDLVRNGVMSYAVFQGWGNDPIAFDLGKNKELLDEIQRLFGGDGPYPVHSTDRVDTLIGITGATFDKQAVFNYVVPAPKMRVIVLDTRTRRKFTGNGYLPPDLVGLDRDAQIPAGPLTDGREVVFIVSAAPVLGPGLIESLAWPLAQVAIDTVNFGKGLDGNGTQKANVGVEKYDAEGWSSNEVAREALLKRVSTYQSAVFLSGDVHFATSVTLDYYKKGANIPSRIVQLTSSPARNQFKAVVRLLVRQNPFLQALETEFRAGRFGWNGASTIVIPTGRFVSPGRRSRIRRSPSLLPSSGWPANTTIPNDKQPDWRWRLSLVRDKRPESAMPSALKQILLPASSELQVTNALASYRSVAARQQNAASTRFDYVRQAVFKSNIGLVRLSKTGNAIVLTHTLISESGPDAVTPADATVHEISLAPSTEPPPAVEFR